MSIYTVARMTYYQAEAESEEQAVLKVKAHINNHAHMIFDWADDGSPDCRTDQDLEFRVIRIKP